MLRRFFKKPPPLKIANALQNSMGPATALAPAIAASTKANVLSPKNEDKSAVKCEIVYNFTGNGVTNFVKLSDITKKGKLSVLFINSAMFFLSKHNDNINTITIGYDASLLQSLNEMILSLDNEPIDLTNDIKVPDFILKIGTKKLKFINQDTDLYTSDIYIDENPENTDLDQATLNDLLKLPNVAYILRQQYKPVKVIKQFGESSGYNIKINPNVTYGYNLIEPSVNSLSGGKQIRFETIKKKYPKRKLHHKKTNVMRTHRK